MSTLQRALHAHRKSRARARILTRSLLMIGALPCCLAHAEIPARKLRALLAPQSPPSCEYKGPDADGLDADLWQRLKLDYERHCYQHAEALVRSRLRALQVSGACEIRARRQRFLRAASSS
jgi:hypothetical protein